jgi:spermidine synthase
MLWSEVHGGRGLNQLLEAEGWQAALLLSAALLAPLLILWRKKKAVYFSIFTTGYATMAFSLMLLLTYQAFFGYIYEMIGLLTASFMIGMALGAQAIKDTKHPLRLLKLLELVAISLFICAPLFFRWEMLFHVINFLCGVTGGMQFATANLCLKGQETTKTAGSLYAADLTGSFLGAFATTLLLMPLWGVQKTLLFLVLIKGMSVILLLSVKYEES